MSLTSSLFSGVSGLSTMGNSMTVIGDNIANVNTVGFKTSRVTFQDMLSQTVATSAGSSQVGRGTALGDISGIFAQGSFESTSSETDLAIGGDGFFIVRDPDNTDQDYYTRAGEFRFDKDGYFTNPGGYIAQGWALSRDDSTGDVEDIGSVTDIRLESFTSAPEKTSTATIIANLDSRADDNTTGTGLPMSQVWDGDPSATQNISSLAYEYQTTVKVYDSLGSTHDITMYYDKAQNDRTFEYILTCNPDEDMRDIFDNADDAGHGMLGRGLLTFTADGILSNQSFERYVGNSGGNITDAGTGTWVTNTLTISGDWTGDTANLLGGPPATETYTFTVGAGGPFTIGTDDITISWASTNGGTTGSFTVPSDYSSGAYVDGPDGITLAFTPGSTATSGQTIITTISQGTADDLSDSNVWADMTGNFTNQHYTFTPDFLGGTGTTTAMDVELDLGSDYNGTNWAPDALSTTQFASGSSTIFQSTDGYGAGSLESISVGVDGALTGQYSNGQVTPLFRVALGNFQNEQGLHKEGGNLFSETRTSGSVITNKPGTNGLGSIAPNSLEQSNVDIASEFVKMITTQRGYQANSKIVTTVDQMLSDTIAMKR